MFSPAGRTALKCGKPHTVTRRHTKSIAGIGARLRSFIEALDADGAREFEGEILPGKKDVHADSQQQRDA